MARSGADTYEDRYSDTLDDFLSLDASDFWSDQYSPQDRLLLAMSFVGKMAFDHPYEVYTDAFGTYSDGKGVASYDPINHPLESSADAQEVWRQSTYFEALVQGASLNPDDRNEVRADKNLMSKLHALLAPKGDELTDSLIGYGKAQREITKLSADSLAGKSYEDGPTSVDEEGRVTRTITEIKDAPALPITVTYTFYPLDDATLGQGEGILEDGFGVFVVSKIG